MNIGVDGTALAPPLTGVGRYIHALLDTLVQEHAEGHFFVYSNAPVDLEPRPNITIRVARRANRGPVWQNLRLPLLLRNDRLDVLWGGNGFLPLPVVGRIGTVVTIHDMVYRFAGETLPPISRLGRRVFQPLSARSADRVIAVSQATAIDVERIYGRRVDTVIHPVVSARYRPAPDEEIARVRAKFGLKEPYLLAVGTVEPRKNLTSLIAACTLCLNRGIRVPRLVLVGKPGWDQHLTQGIQRLGESGSVLALGYVRDEDMQGLYSGADAFVFPSVYEGFGMPLVEAQLCGVPVLYSNRAAMREAAADIGVEFEPTAEGIARVLAAIGERQCRLVCRLPGSIVNSASNSAARLWNLLVAAAEAHKR